jgi:hypothetical protein
MTREDPRWDAYLHERHSPEELRGWARSLAYFRFCRAFGGHANDGDCLRAALAVPSAQDLFDVAAQLGIALERLPADNPEPVVGVRYTGAEFMKFIPSIPGCHPPIRQPGQVRIAGATVFAWVRAGRLDLSMSDDDDPYEVTARTVRDAQAVEARLRPLAHLCIDPPQEGRHCLSPKAHPGLWPDAA